MIAGGECGAGGWRAGDSVCSAAERLAGSELHMSRAAVCLPLSVVVLHDLIGRRWLRVRGAGIAAECRAAIGQSLEFVAEAFAGRHGGEARTCTAGRLPPWPPACHRPRQRRAAHRSSIAMHRSSSLPPLVSSTVSMSLQDPSSVWRICVFILAGRASPVNVSGLVDPVLIIIKHVRRRSLCVGSLHSARGCSRP